MSEPASHPDTSTDSPEVSFGNPPFWLHVILFGLMLFLLTAAIIFGPILAAW